MRSLRSAVVGLRRRVTRRRPRSDAVIGAIDAELVSLELGGVSTRVAVARESTDSYSTWIRQGLWTEPSLAWALRLVEPDWQVLDLGAHVGTFALTVAERCRRVVAVEAMPDNFVLLVAGAANSSATIVPVHAAVASTPGVVGMSDRSAWARVDTGGDVAVPSLTLEDIARVYGDGLFDLIKVDVEGSEWDVMPSLLALVEQQAQAVLIYESNQAVSDVEVRTLHRVVASAGFQQWYLDPRTLQAVELDPERPQYTLNCDILAARGDVAKTIQTDRMSVDHLRRHILAELTEHPVMVHRSYAFCVAQQLDQFLGEQFAIEAAAYKPTHKGAGAEIARFRRILSGS